MALYYNVADCSSFVKNIFQPELNAVKTTWHSFKVFKNIIGGNFEKCEFSSVHLSFLNVAQFISARVRKQLTCVKKLQILMLVYMLCLKRNTFGSSFSFISEDAEDGTHAHLGRAQLSQLFRPCLCLCAVCLF